jgi:hypothetical protein
MFTSKACPAVVAHPQLWRRVASFDPAPRKRSGVKYIVEVLNGVAVLAVSLQAKKEHDKISGTSQAFKRSSADIMADYKKLATPGQ